MSKKKGFLPPHWPLTLLLVVIISFFFGLAAYLTVYPEQESVIMGHSPVVKTAPAPEHSSQPATGRFEWIIRHYQELTD